MLIETYCVFHRRQLFSGYIGGILLAVGHCKVLALHVSKVLTYYIGIICAYYNIVIKDQCVVSNFDIKY